MQTEYKAKLNNGHVEWGIIRPPASLNGSDVVVTVAKPKLPKGERGRRMAEALRKIAASGGIKSIPDPVAWQREIRKDRKLPFRD